ncbi:Saccharopine dehydrogenase-domain-containing protein [Entophlyctis helioformis]|nr:Saccharopine dehydrogenase-domain-containing protein [Entophlyctis helioformis]
MSTVATSSRPYDIVVWGATGFTGALVVEYLTNNAAANGIKFAVGGRNKAKLQQVLDRVAARTGISESADIIIADSNGQDSLDKMVAQAKVVITTVGPYAKYGEKLVSACVRIKTDYVDLTAEPHFIRAMAEKYHDLAVKNNVLIVNSCGFDSIPSDLGTFMVANHFASKGLQTQTVKISLNDFVGGISGGTLASMSDIFKINRISELVPMITNGNFHVPESKDKLTVIPTLIRYDRDFGSWQAFWPMDLPNSGIVRRSNWFNNYGPVFRVTETKAWSNLLLAVFQAVAVWIAFMSLVIPFVGWIVGRIVPPGTGPTDATLKNGRFSYDIVGYSQRNDAGEQVKAKALVKGVSDPGYGETAKMVSEAAMCLALQRAQIGTPATGNFKSLTGGVATTASSMGMLLIERLRKAGMTLTVEDY